LVLASSGRFIFPIIWPILAASEGDYYCPMWSLTRLAPATQRCLAGRWLYTVSRGVACGGYKYHRGLTGAVEEPPGAWFGCGRSGLASSVGVSRRSHSGCGILIY